MGRRLIPVRFLVPTEAETERLRLRQPRGEDWPAYHAWLSDPETVRYTIGRPLADWESWRSVCTMIGHWSVRGYGPYSVVDKASDAVLGVVGFWYPVNWPGPEILYTLARPHRGKGYAREAVRAVQGLARAHLPDTPFISLVRPENRASIRVAESVGARLEERSRFEGDAVLIYRHPD